MSTLQAPTAWWIQPQTSTSISTKVVIIGAGAGGAFAAMTLAEAGIEVVVVERGYHHSNSSMPKDLAGAVANLYAEGGFRTADGTPPFPVAGGQGLGGSTLVNSAICFSTPATTLADWAEKTDGLFADADAWHARQNAIKKVMRVTRTPDRLLSGNDRVHKSAAIRLGWKHEHIHRNTPFCAGCGRCNSGCWVSGKNSVDHEILPRAVKAGATIYSGVRVEHISSSGITATIVAQDGTEMGSFSCAADIIIMAAGTIATPQLLLESEVAPSNREIGKGLHVHPVISTWGVLKQPCYQLGATQGHYVDEFADNNILLEANPIIGGAFFQAFPVYGMAAKELMAKGAHMVSTGALIRDTSEGQVLARKKGTTRILYDVNELDRSRLLEGLKKGAELWLDGADGELVAPSIFGTKLCRSMQEVSSLLENLPASRLINYSSHPQASCRMGRATDLNGRLRGSKNIYVMDASVLPSNVGRNPQITIMSVVRFLSEELARELGGNVKPLST